MYAVIETGGKQHRVIEGETLKVEKINLATGDTLTLDNVLMVGEGDSAKIGNPYVDGSKVTYTTLLEAHRKLVCSLK